MSRWDTYSSVCLLLLIMWSSQIHGFFYIFPWINILVCEESLPLHTELFNEIHHGTAQLEARQIWFLMDTRSSTGRGSWIWFSLAARSQTWIMSSSSPSKMPSHPSSVYIAIARIHPSACHVERIRAQGNTSHRVKDLQKQGPLYQADMNGCNLYDRAL